MFVGLIVSFGSSGVMNQVMSGLTLTYSRALKVGDYVRVANIEGTVTALGTLATKVMTTPRNEEVTIPNAIMLSDAATNYSRNADVGVFAPTSVTIGYDTPWRQVHALLQLAAARTEGVRTDPKPLVLQMGLQDFYVQYTLFVALEQPDRRFFVLDTLHRHIQDAFNEYGVQNHVAEIHRRPGRPENRAAVVVACRAGISRTIAPRRWCPWRGAACTIPGVPPRCRSVNERPFARQSGRR